MLENLNLSDVLFLDIETVSGHASYDDMPEGLQKLWAVKAKSALRIYDRDLEKDEIIEGMTSRIQKLEAKITEMKKEQE